MRITLPIFMVVRGCMSYIHCTSHFRLLGIYCIAGSRAVCAALLYPRCYHYSFDGGMDVSGTIGA